MLYLYPYIHAYTQHVNTALASSRHVHKPLLLHVPCSITAEVNCMVYLSSIRSCAVSAKTRQSPAAALNTAGYFVSIQFKNRRSLQFRIHNYSSKVMLEADQQEMGGAKDR